MSRLARDENSNAVVNTDRVALNKYKQERALHRNIKELNSDMCSIKECLKNITDRIEKIENQINVKT